MSLPFNLAHNEFNVVYTRLSLHYFTDMTTKRIFDDIHKVLKPDGYLCFVCKSIDDLLYGKGTKVEKDMFDNNGHIRHFFSEDYVKLLLENKFEIIKLETGKEKFYGSESAFVKVIAQAIK